jgi:ABC-2 type transport system ATP-binding protein
MSSASPTPRPTVVVRADEIRAFVQDAELDYAVKRLIDFSRDFGPRSRNDVLAISARHNEIKKEIRTYGLTPDLGREREHLTTRLLSQLDLIEQGTSASFVESSALLASVDGPTILRHGTTTREVAVLRSAPHVVNLPQDTPACICEELGKEYTSGPFPFALRGVSLDLRRGRITAVVGANGQGKTTLLRVLAGELPHTAGTLRYPLLSDDDPLDWPQIKRHVAFVPHSYRPSHSRSVETTLRYAAARFGRTGKDNDTEVEAVLHRLGLAEFRAMPFSKLSAGYRIRASLAEALLTNPWLLILDEPLSALDVGAQLHFLEDLRHLAASPSHPCAVVVSSQHLHEIESIADDLLLLDNGLPQFYGAKMALRDSQPFNIFELELDTPRDDSREAVIAACASLDDFLVTRVGSFLIVRTARSSSGAALMRALLEAHITVKYFRDITTSSRALFRHDN